MNSPRRHGVLAALAGAALAIAVIVFLRKCGAPPAEKKKQDLLEALLRLRTQVEWPGLDVAGAAKELGTKEKAFAFVRDDVAYVGYRGSWGGAEGTLRTRVGNTTDKAILLAALLEKQGLKTRLVRAGFPSEPVKPAEGKMPDFPALAEVREIIGPHKGGAAKTVDVSAAVRAEAEECEKKLKATLEAGGRSTEFGVGPQWNQLDPHPKPEIDWVWVQAKAAEAADTAWEDLDPVMPGSKRPENPQLGWKADPATVLIEVDAADERGRSRSLAQWGGPASDLLGHEIALSFLPCICSPDKLNSFTHPSQVGLWAAVLQVGPQQQRRGAFSASGAVVTQQDGKVLLGEGVILEDGDVGQPRPAVPIDTLKVTEVDASRWPRVRLQLVTTSKTRPTWDRRHLDIRAADGKSLPAHLDSAQADPKPLLIALDYSSSMAGEGPGARMPLAKEALKRLIERLDPEQEVGFLIFAGHSYVVLPVKPLKEQKQALLDSIAGTDPNGDGTWIYGAVDRAMNTCTRPSVILLLTDGADLSDEGLSAARGRGEAARKAGHLLIPIGIGGADTEALRVMARAAESNFIGVQRTEDLPAVFGALGNDLAGGLAMTFEAPAGMKPGEKETFQLKVAGYKDPVPVEVTVPAPVEPPFGASRVRLRVTIACPEFGDPMTYVRTLQDLRPGFDAWELLAVRRLGFSVAPASSLVRFAREVDELIEAIRAKRWGAGGAPLEEFSSARGASVRTHRLQADLFHGLAACAPQDLPLVWTGPALFLETKQFAGDAEGASVLRHTLDVFSSSLGPAGDASRGRRLRFSVALAGVEAAILHAESANKPLLEAPSLTVTNKPEGLADFFLPARELAIVTPGARSAWLYSDSADTRTVLVNLRAKGASVEETARQFKRLRELAKALGSLASGGFSAMDHPMSAPFSGLVTYFDVVIKRWCFASVMLGYVSEGIDAGEFDAGKSLASAKKLCEIKGDVGNFQREAAAAFASGYLGGWLEDRVTSAGSGLFGDTRWSKFGFGFGTSWYDPIPDAGTNLATDAMDSGEIP